MAHQVHWTMEVYNEFITKACLTPEEMDVIHARVICGWSIQKQAYELGILAEAKEKMVKCIYYEKITEAMEDAEYGEDYDEDGPMKMGYRGRDERTGRYIARGYRPNEYPFMYDPVDNYRMGYRDGQMNSNMNSGYNQGNNSGNSMGNNTSGNSGYNTGNANSGYNPGNGTGPSRHGMAYDNYQRARRFYTENPTEDKKIEMNESWNNAVDDAIQSLKKMYMDADPMMKRKVNEKMTRALQEMPPM